jgi:hypothetical protein
MGAGASSGRQEIDLPVIDAQLHDPVPWLDWGSQQIELQRGLAIELTLAYSYLSPGGFPS